MKIKSLYISLLILIALGCQNAKNKTHVNQSAKELAQFTDLDGEVISLDNYKGKKVLLNFWATWCVPCLKEMPSMVKAQKELEKENYIFLFASTDPVEKIQAFKEKKDYPFNYIRYSGTLDKLKIFALPSTFIYNSSGQLVDRVDGATEWDSEAILQRLKNIK